MRVNDSAPVRLYSFASPRTDLLVHQHRTLRRFLRDPHELIVVNDLPEPARAGVRDAAASLGLACLEVPAPYCDQPSLALGRTMDFTLRRIGRGGGLSVFLHSDVFLCRPFSILDYMEGFDVAAVPEVRPLPSGRTAGYPCSVLVVLRAGALARPESISFAIASIDGVRCDTGAAFWHYLARTPIPRMRAMNILEISAAQNASALGIPCPEDDVLDLIAGAFLHYKAGSDWQKRGREFHERKAERIFGLLDGLVAGSRSLPEEIEADGARRDVWPAELLPGAPARPAAENAPVLWYRVAGGEPTLAVNAVITCMLAPHVYPGSLSVFEIEAGVPDGIVRLLHCFPHARVMFAPAGGAAPAGAVIRRRADSWLSLREAAGGDEIVPGISFAEARASNTRYCRSCGRRHARSIVERIPPRAVERVRALAESEGLDPRAIPGLRVRPDRGVRAKRAARWALRRLRFSPKPTGP